MKNFLNKTIKLKHLLVFLIFLGVVKFGIEVYQSYHFMEITGKYPEAEANDIIIQEKLEKWWLRI